MSAVHEGGCACGAVRYRVKNAPFRTSVCHCRACQRRTGSAFGRIERHVWTRSAHSWVPIPPEVEKFEKGSVQPPAKPAR